MRIYNEQHAEIYNGKDAKTRNVISILQKKNADFPKYDKHWYKMFFLQFK